MFTRRAAGRRYGLALWYAGSCPLFLPDGNDGRDRPASKYDGPGDHHGQFSRPEAASHQAQDRQQHADEPDGHGKDADPLRSLVLATCRITRYKPTHTATTTSNTIGQSNITPIACLPHC